jgi:hypothetical protein
MSTVAVTHDAAFLFIVSDRTVKKLLTRGSAVSDRGPRATAVIAEKVPV